MKDPSKCHLPTLTSFYGCETCARFDGWQRKKPKIYKHMNLDFYWFAPWSPTKLPLPLPASYALEWNWTLYGASGNGVVDKKPPSLRAATSSAQIHRMSPEWRSPTLHYHPLPLPSSLSMPTRLSLCHFFSRNLLRLLLEVNACAADSLLILFFRSK